MKPSQTAAALRRIASKLDASKNPDRRLVNADIRRILAAVEENQGSTNLEALLAQAEQSGWKLINGVLEIAGSIYQAIALSKNPDAWQVYKGHRTLDASDSYVLYWWFNDEASAENDAGEFIYDAGSPDDYEEGEELPVKNVEEYKPYDAGSVDSDVGGQAHEAEVTARIQGILSGSPTNRWEGALRSDH